MKASQSLLSDFNILDRVVATVYLQLSDDVAKSQGHCTVAKNATFRRITKYTKNTKFAPKKRNFQIFAPKNC